MTAKYWTTITDARVVIEDAMGDQCTREIAEAVTQYLRNSGVITHDGKHLTIADWDGLDLWQVADKLGFPSATQETAYGLTFAEWIDAAGYNSACGDSQRTGLRDLAYGQYSGDMLAQAWRAGEDPADYASDPGKE